MIESKQARSQAFLYLSKIYTTQIINTEMAKALKLNFDVFAEIWEVTAEIENEANQIEDFIFYIGFSDDFPLQVPDIFLSPKDFEKTKYIPHVENSFAICVFEKHNLRLDINKPELIVYECFQKAKKVVEDGIKKNNTGGFHEEFEAYWLQMYSDEESLIKCLSLINFENQDIQEYKLLKLSHYFQGFRYILHCDDELAKRFKYFIENAQKIKYVEQPVFFIKNLDLSTPPFDLKNKQALSKIKEAGKTKEFRKYINDNRITPAVVFTKKINGKTRTFGWIHRSIEVNRKGFRKKSDNPFYFFQTLHKNKNVLRLDIQEYTNQRLLERTQGFVGNQLNSCCFVGLGSVGSNLLHFIQSLNFDEYRLVDYDNLKVENVGRHLLGASYINIPKVDAIKAYILNNRPDKKVIIKTQSLYHVFQQEPDFINNTQFLFVATGNHMLEKWLMYQIEKKVITIPTFFLWVEPYLAGGHCIFLNPYDDENNKFSTYFNENDLFFHNVIDEQEYIRQNPILSKKEAGCQSSYMPYGANELMLFISNLFPKINSIILNYDIHQTRSQSFSWVGDKNLLGNLNINISNESLDRNAGKIYTN